MSDYSLLRRSPFSLAITAIAALLLLMILAGLVAVFVSVLGMIGGPVGKPAAVPSTELLVAILVVLVVIAVLLLLLVWCCCRRCGDRRGSVPPDLLAVLLPILPMLRAMPDLLRDLATSLYATGKTLAWIQGAIDAAGGVLQTVTATAANFEMPMPRLTTEPIMEPDPNNPPHLRESGLWRITGVDTGHKLSLLTLKTSLDTVGDNLKAPGNVPIRTIPQTIEQIQSHLLATAKTLGDLANAIGANPQTPQEVTS